MAANIAQAYITITPKFTGFKQAVESELSGATSSGYTSGQKLGNAFSSGANGLVKSGALVGVFSQVTNAALSSISSHLSDAVSRFDTLNNYPIVMEGLGYSAESANNSISKMSDRLSTLPTRLDDMTTVVKGIAAITGDLDQATDAGLALNDMLLASGSSTQLTTSAMEQFRQMLAKGKPDMQDWKSLTQAMPAQMKQLAQEMLGAGATANDLYAALGGGGAQATITMDELLNAMIRMDTEGSAAFGSLQDQAEAATGGISTSIANMQNAVTKGIAKVFDAIGKDNIAGVFNDMKAAINDAFNVASSAISAVMPLVKSLGSFLKDHAASVIAAGAAYVSFKSKMDIGKTISSLTAAFNPYTAAITLAAVGIMELTSAISNMKTKTENAAKAQTALQDAVETSQFDMYKTTLANVSEQAGSTALSIDELNAKIVETASSISERNATAQEEIATLETARQIIAEYAGQTDLSTAAQGRLSWALEEYNSATGEAITVTDVMANSYTNASGESQNLTESVNNLIEAKKRDIQMEALQDNYSELLTQQKEAADALADSLMNQSSAVSTLASEIFRTNSAYDSHYTWEQAVAEATAQYGDQVDELRSTYDNCSSALSQCEEQMGFMTEAQSENASAIDQYVASLDTYLQSVLNAKGGTAEFAQDLQDLGVSVDDLANLSAVDLENLVTSYDGTTASISSALSNMGVSLDTTKGKTEDLNATPLDSKSATATTDGNAVDGTAKSAITETSTATNNMQSKSVSVNANGNATNYSAANSIWDTVKAIGSMVSRTVSAWVNGNATGGFRLNATGGIRYHASGGYVPRYHASGGAIATRAVPLDIVGEAGAEAIVPLTNQRYSAPFAKTLARQMDNTSSAEAVVQWLASNLGAIINSSVPQTIIDNDAGALIVDNRLNQLQRKAAMNVG